MENTTRKQECDVSSEKKCWNILNICPYTHIFRVIKQSISERKFSATTRQGFLIAILGLLCPFFWYALFTGVRGAELKFHATHSGIFVLIGVVLMIAGFIKIKK